jgi:hypothetical protein
MAWGMDDCIVGGQIRIGTGLCPPIKEGDFRINGTGSAQGPFVIGDGTKIKLGAVGGSATLMIARTTNDDKDCTPADRSLWVKGNTRLQGDAGTSYTLNVTGDVTIIGNTEQTGDTNQVGNITASGTIKAATLIGAHTSGSISGGVSGKSGGAKAFDIPHPSRAGYRLRHICLEGPESAVYFRGRLKNRKVIKLPTYWEKLVDPTTITVNLTPYGSHQDIIVKRLDSTEIHLQSNGGLPIDCFYHVYGTRQDIERLSVEYEGSTSDDYPGDNSIYSINK